MSRQFIQPDQPVVCTGCCLICNQIEISQTPNGDFIVKNACPECLQDIEDFLAHDSEVEKSNIDDSIRRASELIRTAKMPLICGLADQSLEVQRAAIELARSCDAVLDWTVGNSPFALQNALQDTGSVSCTFGEIRERADLVIYWSCNIAESRPAFVERFVTGKPGMTVDWDRKKQMAALRYLRSRTKDADAPEEFIELQQKIDAAAYPVILINDTLAPAVGDTGVLGLFRFVRAQNDRNHCRLVHLSAEGNAFGIQSSLTSMAGGPFGIAFRDGQPVYRGREFSVESLLSKGFVDALMVVGSPRPLPVDLGSNLSKIWLCDGDAGRFQADAGIPISRWGLGTAGTGLRDDGLPVQRPALFECHRVNGVDVLHSIGKNAGQASSLSSTRITGPRTE